MTTAIFGMSCAAAGGGSGKGGATAAAGPGTVLAAPAGPKPPERVADARMGSLTATKWRLGNGLEVILMPDPTATSVSYWTWYRVGSRHENEAAGETGLAHLFEHLMFTQTKGSKEPNEFDRQMEAVGASINAMTDHDFTAYVDNLPPGEIDLAARLEADRMVHLELRKNQVENERDVVSEERLMAVDNSVEGAMDELAWKQAFKSHPYRWPVIGWMKDIKAVTSEKAMTFYQRYYAPANAVVVIAGAIDAGKALDVVVKHYGGLPALAPAIDATKSEKAPSADVRAQIARPLPADKLLMAWPCPPLGDADRAAFDVAHELLLGGPSSRLHKLLVVDKEIASSAEGHPSPTRDAGLDEIWIQMRKGHTAAEAEPLVTAEAARLGQEPVGDAELSKAKNRLETAFWQQLSSSEGKGEALGLFEVVAGDFRRLPDRAAEIAKVTAADVQRVAAAWLGAARSIVVATPK